MSTLRKSLETRELAGQGDGWYHSEGCEGFRLQLQNKECRDKRGTLRGLSFKVNCNDLTDLKTFKSLYPFAVMKEREKKTLNRE